MGGAFRFLPRYRTREFRLSEDCSRLGCIPIFDSGHRGHPKIRALSSADLESPKRNWRVGWIRSRVAQRVYQTSAKQAAQVPASFIAVVDGSRSLATRLRADSAEQKNHGEQRRRTQSLTELELVAVFCSLEVFQRFRAGL